MFDDPERYEHDGFYEEDTDYEDEYETDDSDYIVDDEEDENALWDDEEEAADDLPEKKRRKQKNQVVLADNDTDTEETELSEQAMWQIAKEEQLIEELEADAEEHPFEDGTDEEEPERKKLKRELRAEALARLEDSARTQREFENVIAYRKEIYPIFPPLAAIPFSPIFSDGWVIWSVKEAALRRLRNLTMLLITIVKSWNRSSIPMLPHSKSHCIT